MPPKKKSLSSQTTEKIVTEIADNILEASIFKMMVEGRSKSEIASELVVTERTIDNHLKRLASYTSAAAEFHRENWFAVTMERTEVALKLIMREFNKLLEDDTLSIDFRLYDKLEQAIAMQDRLFKTAGGGKSTGKEEGARTFEPTMTGGSALHNISIAREQQTVASEVMPQLAEHILGDENRQLYEDLTVDDDEQFPG